MNRYLSPAIRRLVLGGAFLAATLLTFLPRTPEVHAGEAEPAARVVLAQADAKATAEAAREAAREAVNAAREATAAAKEAAREARRQAETDAEAAGASRKRGIKLNVGGPDREYDSFEQFVHEDPALAAMFFGVVFIAFLTPLLIIALIIWYKMRKTRMLNETMLQLAEKGIVPPAEALQALNTGRAAAIISTGGSAAPLVEQAKAIRLQAAWSDLRKGVLMGTIGFALTLYSLLDDLSANWLGLVLLFVGFGYIVLWYFEDQQAGSSRTAPPAPPPATPGDLPN